MGVHIHIKRVKDIKNHDFKEAEDIKFDSLRRIGDREFASSNLFHTIHCGNIHCCDYFMNRPKNFDETRKWIIDNIVEYNQKRLLDVLNLMEKDKELYFFFSF